MSYHAFSLDPRTVLGVGLGASPDEIREAYHGNRWTITRLFKRL